MSNKHKILLVVIFSALLSVSCTNKDTPAIGVQDVRIVPSDVSIQPAIRFVNMGSNKVLRTPSFTLVSDGVNTVENPMSMDLLAQIVPQSDANDAMPIQWTTSDESVVSLSVDPADGHLVFLTALAEGSSLITAVSESGLTQSVNITVGRYPVTNIAWDEDRFLVYSSVFLDELRGYRAYDLSRNITLTSDTSGVLPTDMRMSYSMKYAYGNTSANNDRIYLNGETGELRIYGDTALTPADIAVTATTFDGEYSATTVLSFKYRHTFNSPESSTYGNMGQCTGSRGFSLASFDTLGYHQIFNNSAVLVDRFGERRDLPTTLSISRDIVGDTIAFCANDDVMEELIFRVGLDTHVRAGLKWSNTTPVLWDGLDPTGGSGSSDNFWVKYISSSTNQPRGSYNTTYDISQYLTITPTLTPTYSIALVSGGDPQRVSINPSTGVLTSSCGDTPYCVGERVRVTVSAMPNFGDNSSGTLISSPRVDSFEMLVGYSMVEGEDTLFGNLTATTLPTSAPYNHNVCNTGADSIARYPFFIMGDMDIDDATFGVNRTYTVGASVHVTEQNMGTGSGSITVFCYDLENGGAPEGSSLTLDLGANGKRAVDIPTSKPRQIRWTQEAFLSFGLSRRVDSDGDGYYDYATYPMRFLTTTPNNARFNIVAGAVSSSDPSSVEIVGNEVRVYLDKTTKIVNVLNNDGSVKVDANGNPITEEVVKYVPTGAGREVRLSFMDSSGAMDNATVFLGRLETEKEVSEGKIDSVTYDSACSPNTTIHFVALKVDPAYTHYVRVLNTPQGAFEFHESTASTGRVTGCSEGGKTEVNVLLGLDMATWLITDTKVRWAGEHYISSIVRRGSVERRHYLKSQVVNFDVAGNNKGPVDVSGGSLVYKLESVKNYYSALEVSAGTSGVRVEAYCREDGAVGDCDVNIGSDENYRQGVVVIPEATVSFKPMVAEVSAQVNLDGQLRQPTTYVLYNYKLEVSTDSDSSISDATVVPGLYTNLCANLGEGTMAVFTGVPEEFASAITDNANSLVGVVRRESYTGRASGDIVAFCYAPRSAIRGNVLEIKGNMNVKANTGAPTQVTLAKVRIP